MVISYWTFSRKNMCVTPRKMVRCTMSTSAWFHWMQKNACCYVSATYCSLIRSSSWLHCWTSCANACVDDFVHTTRYFWCNEIFYQKGIYPYDYVNGLSRLNETALPPKAAFYNSLTDEHIDNSIIYLMIESASVEVWATWHSDTPGPTFRRWERRNISPTCRRHKSFISTAICCIPCVNSFRFRSAIYVYFRTTSWHVPTWALSPQTCQLVTS